MAKTPIQVDYPSWTAVPNSLFEALADLSEAELKVAMAIVRETLGWHKKETTISLSEIAALTGLSKGSCCDATTGLAERGMISKESNKGSEGECSATTYRIKFKEAPPFAQPNAPIRNSDNPPFAQPNGIRNKEINLDKKEEPSVGSLTENLPEPTHQDVINRINSQGPGLLGAGARFVVKATDISGLTLDEAVARCRARLKNHRGVSARPSNTRAPRQPRQPAQREDPNAGMADDASFQSFRQCYPGVSIDSDWEKAWPLWLELDPIERAKALIQVVTCDPAFVKTPRNYLRDKEFERPPRPEPKSNSQKLLEMA